MGPGQAPLEVIPAIDLKGGRCVRLYQGDFQREEVFSQDPVAVALGWQEQGAPRLHIVDLDGAALGRPMNLEAIKRIAGAVDVPLQVGGGVRDLDVAGDLLGSGVQRVVLGTSAVEAPDFVSRALESFGPEAVVVSVDARDGRVALWGWKEQAEVPALEHLARMGRTGVRRFVYTDISRDGTLTEPNFSAVAEVVAHTGLPILAAGGIATVEHLVRLAALGVEGAIIGRALYTGAISLPSALEAVAKAPHPDHG